MENEKIFKQLPPTDVEVFATREQINGRVMCGKALYTGEQDRFAFVENPPRVKRSKLVLASSHASLRKRANGDFSINVVFTAGEKYIKESLINEVRGLVKAAQDYKDEE